MPQQMTEEQVKAIQEKLKNMTPEQLKEFQKQQCIFCQIVKGKVASKKIYEDERCIAILDINPANPGHVLLMPKEHYSIMPQLPENELGHLAMVSKAISHLMLNALKAEGTNIFIANGIAAGQKSQHFMMHIIPRKKGDLINLDVPETAASAKEMLEIKKRVQERIKSLFKLNYESEVVEQKEEQTKENKQEIKEELFVTSEKAKKYHKETCPFAQKISKEKRIIMTKESMEKSEKAPCACIKAKEEINTIKKIKLKKEKKGGVSLDSIADLFR